MNEITATILAIDDNKDNILILKALLKESFPGIKFLSATDGKTGIELARREDPDVILLDVVMPGLDGFEVCTRIKSDDYLKHIPVVFITALRTDKQSRIKALEMGAEAFLAKPIDETELAAQVRAMTKVKAANRLRRMEKDELAFLVEERTRELERNRLAMMNLLEDLKEENLARQATELKLRESEEKYRAMVEYSPDAIIVHAEGQLLFANRAAIQLVGAASLQEMQKKSLMEFVHPDYRAMAIERIKKIYETGQPAPFTEEKFILPNTGEAVDVEVIGLPVHFDNKIAIQTTIRDITERKKNADLLKASEEKYRMLYEAMPIGIGLADLQGNILDANPAMINLMGYSLEEFRHLNVIQSYQDPAQRKHLEKLLKEKGRLLGWELGLKRKDGTFFFGLLDVFQVKMEGETRLLTTLRDISREKQSDDELKRQKNFFEQMFLQSCISTQILDKEGNCERINSKLSEIFGVEADQMEQGRYNIFLDKEIQVSGVANHLEKVFKQGKTADWEVNFDIGHAADSTGIEVKERKQVWFDNWAYPIYDGQGQLSHVIIQHTDISKRKEVEASLSQIIRLHEIILGLATGFVNVPLEKLDEQINKTLSIVGEFIEVDRAYLFEYDFSRRIMINTHEWCSPGTSAEIDNLKAVPFDAIPDWVDSHVAGKLVHVADVQSLHPENNLRKILEPQSIKILITLPLAVDGVCTGFVGFDVVKGPRHWSDQELSLLKVLAEVLSNSTGRRRAELIQVIQYNIADAMVTTHYLSDLFAIVRKELDRLLDATNFFIALYDEKKQVLYTPFERDEQDTIIDYWPAEKSLTGLVVLQNKSILLNKGQIKQLADEGKIEYIGSRAEMWLGVPLAIGERVIGAIVVQSYNNPNAYNRQSLEVLEIIANQLSIYIDQKRAQEEMVKLSKALEQSPVSIVITNPEGVIEYVNPKFIQITQYKVDEVIGQTPRVLKSGKQDDAFYDKLWKTIKEGKDWSGELQNKKKNGELYWENAIISPIFNEKGQITHYLGLKEDITDKKTMMEQLIVAKEKAEQSDRLKSSFLANMSHELRTPLTGILGFSELMHDAAPNPEQERMSSYILESGRRLLDTLNLILDLSKLESEQVKIAINNVDIIALLVMVTETHRPAATKKGLRLGFQTDLPDLVSQSNERLLASIFHNLVNNAVKYTEKGSVDVTLSREGDRVLVKVKDTGIGIAEENQEMVFEDFRQVSEGFSRHFEGTGLGLTITRKFVNKLEGSIWVESVLGQGSCFTVSLPFVPAEVTAEEPSKPQKAAPGTKAGDSKAGKKKILLVEDELVNQQVLVMMLESHYVVTTATDGIQALDLLNNNTYDIVLLDINLGAGMTGVDVLHEMRTYAHCKSIPVIAITAYAMKGDREKFLSEGFSGYLSKPFNRAAVLEALQAISP